MNSLQTLFFYGWDCVVVSISLLVDGVWRMWYPCDWWFYSKSVFVHGVTLRGNGSVETIWTVETHGQLRHMGCCENSESSGTIREKCYAWLNFS